MISPQYSFQLRFFSHFTDYAGVDSTGFYTVKSTQETFAILNAFQLWKRLNH